MDIKSVNASNITWLSLKSITWKAERERVRAKWRQISPSTLWRLKCLSWQGLGHAVDGSPGLHLGSLHGWEELKHLSHHFLPPRVCSSRKLDQEWNSQDPSQALCHAYVGYSKGNAAAMPNALIAELVFKNCIWETQERLQYFKWWKKWGWVFESVTGNHVKHSATSPRLAPVPQMLIPNTESAWLCTGSYVTWGRILVHEGLTAYVAPQEWHQPGLAQ